MHIFLINMTCNRPYKEKITKRLWEDTCRWAKKGEPSSSERSLGEKTLSWTPVCLPQLELGHPVFKHKL